MSRHRHLGLTFTLLVAFTAPAMAQDVDLTPEEQAKFDKLTAFLENVPAFLPTVNIIDPAALPVTFPYREVQEHVVVDVDFGDGVALPFMLDTGAQNYVTPDIASAWGGEAIVETAGAAAGGKIIWSPLMLMSDLTIGGVLKVGRPTGGIGWSADGAFHCVTQNGLIGAPLMRNAVWQINYGARQITVAAEVGQLQHIDGAIAIPFTFRENSLSPTPHVMLGVGTGTLEFVLDTGGGIPLTINTADLATVGVALPADAPSSAALAGGAAGGFEMKVAVTTVPIRFGDREVMVPVTVGDGMAPGANGNIGHTFLKNFVVTFDWSSQMIYLDPLFAGDTVPAIGDPAGVGIGLQGDQLVVTAIPQGGPADVAGLTLGETVTMVDGQDVTAITQDAFCVLKDTKPSTVTTASGKTYDASPIPGFFDTRP